MDPERTTAILPPTADAAPQGHGFQWRPLREGETNYELIISLVSPTMGLLSWIMLQMDLPWNKCKLKIATGFPCPTCGGSRCVTSLVLDQDIVASFAYNPLVFIVLSILSALFFYAVIVQTFKLPRLRLTLPKTGWRIFRWSLLALIILNWFYLVKADI